MIQAGFEKEDITPRAGVELAGFGPYIHRRGTEIRDRLFARAMALSDGPAMSVLVSCDLIILDDITVAIAREIIEKETGIPPERCMLHAIHTHSAPAVRRSLTGWDEPDAPYMVRLPHLILKAVKAAVASLEEVTFCHREVDVKGIAYNREHERPAYEDAVKDNWEPEDPYRTDLKAHVITAKSGGEMKGFLSSYSCHPVVCCEETHSIHGDFAGVATNKLEGEHPGVTGLFLQGALGDINACVAHTTQEKSMKALDIVAERYASFVREGFLSAEPIGEAGIAWSTRKRQFSTLDWTAEALRDMIGEFKEVVLQSEDDASAECRINTVRLLGAQKMLARMEGGLLPDAEGEIQAFRIGDLYILGLPFETFYGIKKRILKESGIAKLLVLSTTNHSLGYAPTAEHYRKSAEGSQPYTTTGVPFICGRLPFTENLEDEIVEEALSVLNTIKM